MSPVVYLNGEYLPEAEAVVSIYDAAFMHGAGLFETMRAEQGRVFRLEAHLNRLMMSASKLLAPIERDALPSGRDFATLLARNDLREARVRLTVSAGSVLQGAYSTGVRHPRGVRSDSSPTRSSPTMGDATVCATAAKLSSYPPETYRNGVTVMIARRKQTVDDPLAGHKTTCYLPHLLDLRAAHAARCSEALLFNQRSELAEGTISNVFVVRQGRLRTPPLSTPVLPGIARSLVLELAQALGLGADDRTPITIDDLLDADEVFLTNAIMLVLPVIRVEKRDIADAKPGPITRKMLGAYRDRVQLECGGNK